MEISEFVAALPNTRPRPARTAADLAGLARAGARAAFCPEPTRRAILAEIDQLIPTSTTN